VSGSRGQDSGVASVGDLPAVPVVDQPTRRESPALSSPTVSVAPRRTRDLSWGDQPIAWSLRTLAGQWCGTRDREVFRTDRRSLRHRGSVRVHPSRAGGLGILILIGA